jgi:DNA-binding SARP family transcriptional activator/class 3 adenylate cyclase/alpha-beta hydrolase superfamily lysophospholipase
MEFRILGPLEVRDGNGPLPLSSGKQCALLADLLLNANQSMSTARLVDDLWGDHVPDTAVKALQVYVSKLRKTLPQPRVHTRGSGYLLEVAPDELDFDTFTRLTGEGRAAIVAGAPDEASEKLTKALALWRGPALAEFVEPFAQNESARLEELRLGALEERIDADLALGRHAALVPELEALANLHPLRERIRSQLILALYRSGRQAEALDAYQRFRRTLDEELGIEPTPALRELERSILQQDTSLDVAATISPRSTSKAQAPPEESAIPAPVGRDRELGTLTRLLDEAIDGHRRVVFVTGEAGAGKTTLVDAVLAACRVRDRLLVARGQCIENRGLGEPYLPVLDAVGRIGRGGHGPLVVEQLRRFAPTWLVQLPSLVPDDERAWVAERASGLTTERMLREMTEALDAIAAEVPVVVVLEDLHWSDPSTLTLVDAIARRPDDERLMLVATSRSGREGVEVGALARALRVRNLCTEIAIGPLTPTAVAEYLDVRLPGHQLPTDVSDDVALRTRGVPLFVEKLVDSWLEEGAVVPGEDGWTVTIPLERLRADVPESLRELIVERVRPLPQPLRDLLDAASVVGADFTAALVAAAVERPEEEVESQLDALAVDGSLIESRPNETWPDETITTAYAFAHELVVETLYGEIAAARRARLHDRIGTRLAEGRGDSGERAAQLAWHFTQAGDAERAVRHLLTAAGRAFEKTAAKEAQRHVGAALELVPRIRDDRTRAELELTALLLDGSTRILTEGFASPQVEASFVRSVDLARAAGDPTELASALTHLAGVYEICGRYSASEGVVAQALMLPQDELRGDLLVSANELMACSLVHQGRHSEALEASDRALEYVSSDVPASPVAVFGESPGVSVHVWSSLALWHLGRPESALARAEQGVAAAVVAPRAFARSMASVNAAIVSQLIGRPTETRRWAEAAIDASQRSGYPYWLSVASILRGWARAVEGDAAEGLAEMLPALAAARETGARLDDAYFLALVADVHLRAGDTESGLRAVEEALEEMQGERSFFCEPDLHRLRGELLLASGDDERGVASLEHSIEIARRQGAHAYELRAAVSLARALRARAAAEQVARILSTFSEGRQLPDLVAARAVLDDLGVEPLEHESGSPVGGRVGSSRPPVRYANSGSLSIAYQVTGVGPPDLVLVPGFVSHLDKDWEDPRHAHFLDRLGSFSRLIRFDKRGTGLSDRPQGLPDLETRMDDVRAVMDDAGSERAIVFGYSEGGPLAVLFAATYPERVEALVLFGSYAKRVRPDDDYPWAATVEARAAHVDDVAREGGLGRQMRWMSPSADETMATWWEERGRAAASPGAVRALLEMNSQIDVRDALRAVRVPALVVHRRGDAVTLLAEGRYLAQHIPRARLVELDGADHFVAIDPDQILDVVEPFVRGVSGPSPGETPDRVLATMMFTDIVGSTELAVELGDAAWTRLLDRHHEIVREELARFGGEEIDTAGDGFLALFDGPARAIRCGRAISDRMRELEIDVRVGVHTGEVERAQGSLRGIAVHVAARVADAAGPRDVLVSATTRDLVAGSELAFDDRGEHSLKGLDGSRRLYASVS